MEKQNIFKNPPQKRIAKYSHIVDGIPPRIFEFIDAIKDNLDEDFPFSEPKVIENFEDFKPFPRLPLVTLGPRTGNPADDTIWQLVVYQFNSGIDKFFVIIKFHRITGVAIENLNSADFLFADPKIEIVAETMELRRSCAAVARIVREPIENEAKTEQNGNSK